MILGYNAFLSQYSDTKFPSNGYYRIELQNGIFDAIEGFNDITKTYTSDKEDWTYESVINAEFRGDLEGGNIDVQGQEIQYILFQKRRQDELQYHDIATLDYDKAIKLYQIIDYYVANNQDYEYCVVPVTATIRGNRNTAEITPDYDGVWLTDSQNNVQLLCSLQIGDMENVTPNALIETLGGKYPIVTYQGDTDYIKSSVKGTLLSKEFLQDNSNQLTVNREKLNRDNIISFVKNKKPKLYRNAGTGEVLMICAINNPKFMPDNNAQGRIGDINFDFVEIGDFEDENDMKDYGFIE